MSKEPAQCQLTSAPQPQGLPILVVALVGVAVNLAATWVLAHADRSNLNVRAAFAHVVTEVPVLAVEVRHLVVEHVDVEKGVVRLVDVGITVVNPWIES